MCLFFLFSSTLTLHIPLILVCSEFADRREGINPAVNAEVGGIFKGKTTNQLRLLEEQIRNKLTGGEGVDVGMFLYV